MTPELVQVIRVKYGKMAIVLIAVVVVVASTGIDILFDSTHYSGDLELVYTRTNATIPPSALYVWNFTLNKTIKGDYTYYFNGNTSFFYYVIPLNDLPTVEEYYNSGYLSQFLEHPYNTNNSPFKAYFGGSSEGALGGKGGDGGVIPFGISSGNYTLVVYNPSPTGNLSFTFTFIQGDHPG